MGGSVCIQVGGGPAGPDEPRFHSDTECMWSRWLLSSCVAVNLTLPFSMRFNRFCYDDWARGRHTQNHAATAAGSGGNSSAKTVESTVVHGKEYVPGHTVGLFQFPCPWGKKGVLTRDWTKMCRQK